MTNDFTSPGVGIRPIRSNWTRRKNSASPAIGARGIPSRSILSKMWSSMKFVRTTALRLPVPAGGATCWVSSAASAPELRGCSRGA